MLFPAYKDPWRFIFKTPFIAAFPEFEVGEAGSVEITQFYLLSITSSDHRGWLQWPKSTSCGVCF